MAVVGTAKNARVVISGVVTNYVLVTEITIRGNRYRFNANNGAGYMNSAEIVKLPSTVLGTKNTWSGLSTIEAIDNRLRMWKGSDTWENTPANVRIEVFDSTHLVSGTWELVYGTLVSFTSLDAATYSLSYNANGGTGTIAPEEGIRITTQTAGFTRDAYQLTGWNTQADGSGEAFALGAQITLAGDVTLYAVWSELTYGKVAIDGAWRDVVGRQICIGGAWREVVSAQIIVDGAWRDV